MLALVLVLALVLSTAIITFTRRAIIDTMIVRNRDAVARAETLARGGVRLATALVLEDLLIQGQRENGGNGDSAPGETLEDLWARVGESPLITADGDILMLQIEDAGARLNLNALVDFSEPTASVDEEAEIYLAELFEKVIDEIPLPPGEKLYDASDLAENLLDYIDPNEIRIRGGAEDDYYQRQDPRYRAANRTLLSVDELRRVEGFDDALVEALRPYVTVYPLVASQGINLNTAPPHVLATVYHGTGGSRRLANADLVRDLLAEREAGRILCDQTEVDSARCTLVASVGVEGSIYPPTTMPAESSVFRVVSVATVRGIRRQVEAVIDRSVPSDPRLLSWRVR